MPTSPLSTQEGEGEATPPLHSLADSPAVYRQWQGSLPTLEREILVAVEEPGHGSLTHRQEGATHAPSQGGRLSDGTEGRRRARGSWMAPAFWDIPGAALPQEPDLPKVGTGCPQPKPPLEPWLLHRKEQGWLHLPAVPVAPQPAASEEVCLAPVSGGDPIPFAVTPAGLCWLLTLSRQIAFNPH